jgi:hypothetical protein
MDDTTFIPTKEPKCRYHHVLWVEHIRASKKRHKIKLLKAEQESNPGLAESERS